MFRISSLIFAAAMTFAPAAATAQNTIADIVVAASGGATAGQFDNDRTDYDILLTALQTANLVGAVADPNADITVFAPNDRAFIRLAKDLGYVGNDESDAWDFLVTALTQLGNGNPVPVLTDVLLYHVAPQRISAFSVILRSIFRVDIPTALTGATIKPRFFRLQDNDPDLRDPRLMRPINLTADNGIIHGINRILIPLDI
ncbi:MAG: fasciclin domain-containing protein [bacterium]|nr:fasciclin domain-containing protein [bacterium]